jgi:DNA-binding transcriptional regulator YiaG
MPKQRPPFDGNRYEALRAQGLSQRAIAQEMGMPEATLRNNLKVLGGQPALGTPMDVQGPSERAPQPQGRPEVHQDMPRLATAEVDAERPQVDLERYLPGMIDDLQSLLAWWRTRQQAINEPAEKLERVTYHVSPKWIEAVRREADLTGDSYAAVVNRAFRQYFEGKAT